MVRITRVYTKKGDKGTTQITRSLHLSKNSLRVAVFGTLDELNAYLGWCVILLQDDIYVAIKSRLLQIQNTLFDIGASLCTENKRKQFKSYLNEATLTLEQDINMMNKELTPLNSFVLPGGDEITARLHIARTVCRRTERELVAFAEESNETVLIPFINRLSDWLFVAARFNLKLTNTKEYLWQPKEL